MRRIAASALLATTLFALGACGTSEGSADVSAVGTWLSALSTANVESDTLHVFDSAGSEIGTLDRQDG